jgi:hypothetical protein
MLQAASINPLKWGLKKAKKKWSKHAGTGVIVKQFT